MSPRRLDPDSVQGKLAAMEPLIDRLGRLAGASGDDLRADLDRRLIAERLLTVLVETAVGVNGHIATTTGHQLTGDYRSTFGAAAAAGAISDDLARRLAPSTGLRNRLAHRYGEVDLDIVAAAIPQAHDDFSEYVRQVARWLATQVGAQPGGTL